jgi:hypothetical protein
MSEPTRWNPFLPTLPEDTDPALAAAINAQWRKDLLDQRIAAAMVRHPFPLIDLATGKAVQIEVEELE